MQPVVVFLSLVCSALGATFYQKDSHQGSGFLKSFTVESIPDPTHGRVYVITSLFPVISVAYRPVVCDRVQ
jgi:hypothetical protein